MADLVTLSEAITIAGSASTSTMQPLSEVIDVSGYDSIDFQVSCLAVNGANGITVSIYTSMQNKVDDGSWMPTAVSVPLTTGSTWKPLRVPDLTNYGPLLRYIRYEVARATGVTSSTTAITGLARRGVR